MKGRKKWLTLAAVLLGVVATAPSGSLPDVLEHVVVQLDALLVSQQ